MHVYLLEGHGIYNLWESNTAVNFLKMATNLGEQNARGKYSPYERVVLYDPES